MLIKWPSILEGLHGRSALAVFSLIGSLVIIILHEVVQVLLDSFNGFVELLSEGDFIELVLDGLVETLRGTIGLRMSHLGSRMFYSTQMLVLSHWFLL